MESIDRIKQYLADYDEPITLMEVCGSHTAAIAKSGIKSIISDRIRLVSGPGCPVCVTPTAYIDRLIELAKEPDTCVVTFGDLLRVPGSYESLNEAKSDGARVHMVYSPMDILKLAADNSEITYVFAAVGFETTTPIYALLVEQLETNYITNVKLLTALKTMTPAIKWLCENGARIDGFIAPGHVCVITGSDAFIPLANRYGIPFGVAGFKPEELLAAIYGLVKVIKSDSDKGRVINFYPAAVTQLGNVMAQEKVDRYFEESDAAWRGMGIIEKSGRVLKEKYSLYDAGSYSLTEDNKLNKACQCDKVLMGRIEPGQCPLFNRVCNPQNPQGACMVSSEGSCYSYYMNGN